MSVTLTDITVAAPGNTVTLTGIMVQTPPVTVTLTGIMVQTPPLTVTLTDLSAITVAPAEVVLNRTGSGVVQLMRQGIGPVTLHRVPAIPQPLGMSGDWSLLWSDEFDTILDPAIWMQLRGTGSGYGDPYNPSNDGSAFSASYSTVENGNLRIRWDATPITVSSVTYPHTTGIAHTGKGFSYLYGYIEARIWLPADDGLWPAFWMLPLPVDSHWPPEIDISEWLFNSSYGTIEPHFNVHWLDTNSVAQEMGWKTYGSADVGGNWHVYGLNWQPGKMQIIFDGIAGPSYTGTGVTSEAMYIIFSGGVRKGYSPPAGNMLVDYVRVWQ